MKSILRRLGLPHLVVVLAVALVLGSGTAYAAKQITSKNIKNNTVKSVDIKDGNLTGTDVADASLSTSDVLDGTLTGADVANSSLTGTDVQDGTIGSADITDSTITTNDVAADTLTAADLDSNSVESGEIATDAVNASEIANDSIDSGEVVDFQLSNEDIGVLFAQVSAAGALSHSSSGVSVTNLAGAGTYAVDFGRNIAACAFFGTVGGFDTATASGSVNVADRFDNVEAVFVNTDNSAGTNADLPFHLLVVC